MQEVLLKLNDKCTSMNLPYYSRDLIQNVIFKTQKFFEQDDLLKSLEYIENGVNILDCGANIGNHSLFYATHSDCNKIYSFEPQFDIYEQFIQNININNLTDKIIPNNTALGDHIGHAVIKESVIGNYGGTSFKSCDDGPYKLTTVDQYCLENNINNIGFMKIDVEGHQLQLLNGALVTLKMYHPTIWIEMLQPADNDKKQYNYDDEVVKPTDLLESIGYVLDKKYSHSNFIFKYRP